MSDETQGTQDSTANPGWSCKHLTSGILLCKLCHRQEYERAITQLHINQTLPTATPTFDIAKPLNDLAAANARIAELEGELTEVAKALKIDLKREKECLEYHLDILRGERILHDNEKLAHAQTKAKHDGLRTQVEQWTARAKVIEAERAELAAALLASHEVLEEFARSPYTDSDLVSLLQTLKARALRAMRYQREAQAILDAHDAALVGPLRAALRDIKQRTAGIARAEKDGTPPLKGTAKFLDDLSDKALAAHDTEKDQRIAELENTIHEWEETDAAATVLRPILDEALVKPLVDALEEIRLRTHRAGCPALRLTLDYLREMTDINLCDCHVSVARKALAEHRKAEKGNNENPND